MDIYASDEEKAEEIKRWWRENGRSVITGVIFGVAAIFGVKYWLNFQQVTAEQASLLYQQFNQQLLNEDKENAVQSAQQLMTDYPSTAYAAFSAFQMAQSSVINGEFATAKDNLQWIITSAKLESHKSLAKLRLARLLVSEAKYEEAMLILESISSQAYTSLVSELKGDIYVAEGNNSQAQEAYSKAKSTTAAGEPRHTLLSMKLDNVAVVNEH